MHNQKKYRDQNQNKAKFNRAIALTRKLKKIRATFAPCYFYLLKGLNNRHGGPICTITYLSIKLTKQRSFSFKATYFSAGLPQCDSNSLSQATDQVEYRGIIYQNIVKGMKVLIDAKAKLGKLNSIPTKNLLLN